MTTPVEAATTFAQRTYRWLVGLDPASFPVDGVPEARAGLAKVLDASAALDASFETTLDPALDRLKTDARTLQDALPAVDALGNLRTEWLDARVEISPLYEAFALALKEAGGRAKHLHPTNVKRSLVHLASGLMVVAAFQFVFTPTTAVLTAGGFVVWAWSLEYARRVNPTVNRWCMVFFGPIARDHERYRINSATWYGTSLLVLALTAYGPAGVLGLLALAVGDPVAGIVGRSYGRTRLYGGKSLEGSAAFAASAALLCFVYLLAFPPVGLGIGWRLLAALVAGVTGAVVELLSTRLEDNFTIPVLTAWVSLLFV
jgi:dolichol kinase